MLRTLFGPKKEPSNPQAHSRIQAAIHEDAEYSDFFANLSTIGDKSYYQAIKRRDVASVTNITPYPSCVSQEKTGKLGYLPEINKFYLINREKIYLWTPQQSDVSIVSENDINIIAVATMDPDYDYISSKVSKFIAISTHSYIKLYPIIDSRIITDRFYIVRTNFTPLSMIGGPNHLLYVGSQLGDIYIVKITQKMDFLSLFSDITDNIIPFRADAPPIGAELTRGSQSILSYITPEFVRFRDHSYIKLVYDPTTNYLAAVDDDSNIYFYKCTDTSISKVGSHFSGNIPLVDISFVPRSDSELIRFIGFDQKGNRLYFGHSDLLVGHTDSVKLKYIRKTPPEYEGKNLISGAYTSGYCCMVYNDGVFVARSMITTTPCEEINAYPLNCAGAHVFPLRHEMDDMKPIYNFYDAEYLQHFTSIQPSFLLCSLDGTASIRPTLPYENLARCIQEDRSSLKLFIQEPRTAQGCSQLLLVAQKMPEVAPAAFQILEELSTNLISDTVFKRAARLLNPLLTITAVSSCEDGYIVSDEICRLPRTYLTDMNAFNDVIRDVIEIQQDPAEKENLAQLMQLIKELSEVVTFIFICATQKQSIFDKAVNAISHHSRSRLQKKIGDAESLVEPCQELLRQIVMNSPKSEELDLLCQQFSDQCPIISDIEAGLTAHAESLLNDASIADDKKRYEILREAASAFQEICVMFGTNISSAIRRLTELGAPGLAVEVALAWAKKVDPSGKAGMWFDCGCDRNDSQGSMAFAEVHRIYVSAISAAIQDEGLTKIVDSGNKIFAYTVFEYLISAKQEDKLLSINSPLVEEFVRANQRKLLWRIIARTDKKAAIKELIHIAVDADSIEFSERIDLLKQGLKLAKEANSKELFDECESFISSAVLAAQLKEKPTSIVPMKKVADLADLEMNLQVALKAYTYLNDSENISRVWKLIVENEPENVAQILYVLPPKSIAADLKMIIPILEDIRSVNDKLEQDYPVMTLIKANANLREAAEIYQKLVELAEGKQKGFVILSALRLLRLGHGNKDKINKIASDYAKDESKPLAKEIKELIA